MKYSFLNDYNKELPPNILDALLSSNMKQQTPLW